MEHYDRLRRERGELSAEYVQRFKRAEHDMREADLVPQVGEARAWKFLSSRRLPDEKVEKILAMTGGQYDFDLIIKSLEILFSGFSQDSIDFNSCY